MKTLRFSTEEIIDLRIVLNIAEAFLRGSDDAEMLINRIKKLQARISLRGENNEDWYGNE